MVTLTRVGDNDRSTSVLIVIKQHYTIRTSKLTLWFLQSFITNALPKLSYSPKGPKHTQNKTLLSHSETCKKKATNTDTVKAKRERTKEMDLEAVGDLVLHTILSNLTPKDTAIAACVSNKLKSSASADILWSKFCSQELDLNEPIDPLGNPTPSFKVRTSFFAFSPMPILPSSPIFIRSLLGFLYSNICFYIMYVNWNVKLSFFFFIIWVMKYETNKLNSLFNFSS